MATHKYADAAKVFAKRWKQQGSEKSQTHVFWMGLLGDVFGVADVKSYIDFERPVEIDGTTKFVDAYLPRTRVLIEQKSLGVNLRAAHKQSDGPMLTPYQQAERYAQHIVGDDNPLWIVVCNFATFEIYNRRDPRPEPYVVRLDELDSKLSAFDFLTDHTVTEITIEKEISVEAGRIVGKLYDKLLAQYKEPNEHSLRSLNALCVRLVFCLYAEDAELLGRRTAFREYLSPFAPEQMRRALADLFRILDTPEDQRDKYLADDNPLLASFPYVNGGLFADVSVEIPPFTHEIKEYLLHDASANFNWRDISPTIFGAVFESTLNPATRRSGGMHYTSRENIHKVIDPLFLNDLYAQYDRCSQHPSPRKRRLALHDLQERLGKLTFLDPACGSGNFLTESYISLRRLENKILSQLLDTQNQGAALDLGGLVKVSIHQFYGIEVNDFATTVAKTAMWIAESQMIDETENIVQQIIPFLPLRNYANIVEGNALRLDWSTLDQVAERNLFAQDKPHPQPSHKVQYDYILGNPPFVGYAMQTAEQKKDIADITKLSQYIGKNIDYVACWYFKAAQMIKDTNTKCAFVSTNSVCQGEQVVGVWKPMFETFKIQIIFAYRTFPWDSESSLKARVHCVIVGMGSEASLPREKTIYDGDQQIKAQNINPYLIDAPNVFVERRIIPICKVPEMTRGSQPTDDGNFILTEEEKNELLKTEPQAEQLIRPFMMGKDFIDRKPRYCLWLVGANPSLLRQCPLIMKRVAAVREFRLNSTKAATQKKAETPTLFDEVKQVNSDYVAIPKVSSENREYIPIDYLPKEIIPGDKLFVLQNATLYHFGVLTSSVHMAWMRAVCGRLEMRYSYSNTIVYNNFVWPSKADEAAVAKSAQAILDARALYPDSSLADLYDPNTMPPELRRAHTANDRAVLRAYGWPADLPEAEIVARLFALYQARVRLSQRAEAAPQDPEGGEIQKGERARGGRGGKRVRE